MRTQKGFTSVPVEYSTTTVARTGGSVCVARVLSVFLARFVFVKICAASSWLLELIMDAAVGVLWLDRRSCITSEMAMPAIFTICGNFSLIARCRPLASDAYLLKHTHTGEHTQVASVGSALFASFFFRHLAASFAFLLVS